MARGKTKIAIAVAAGAAILSLLVVVSVDRSTQRVEETGVGLPQTQQMTEEDREYFRHQMNSYDCSGLITLDGDADCGQSLSREEWRRSRRELEKQQLELEEARAENTILQERLRQVVEHKAQPEGHNEAETPRTSPSKGKSRPDSRRSDRKPKQTRTSAQDWGEDPLTDFPFLD